MHMRVPAMPSLVPNRVLSALLALVVSVLVAGCSGTDVDQTEPGRAYEFTGATPSGQVIPPADRAPAPVAPNPGS